MIEFRFLKILINHKAQLVMKKVPHMHKLKKMQF
jgi:hypothetical protein